MDINKYLNPEPVESVNRARMELRKIKKILVASIPEGTSEENQLADKLYVANRISEADAIFKGTFSSYEQLVQEVTDANRNDYAYVEDTDSSGNSVYKKYKWTETGWQFEFSIDRFTETQRAAINSGINSDKVTKLDGIESGAQVHKAPTTEEVKSALGTSSGTSKYLREDGQWVTPPDTDTWRPVSNSVSSTDESTAASSKAVKTAYDLATSTNNTLASHTADTTIHITAAERTSWNNKVNTADIVTEITPLNSDSTNPIATKVIVENEKVIAEALIDLNNRISQLEEQLENLNNN